MTEDSRIKLIQNPKNIGLSGARNEGLKAVTSPYIIFLDPNDWYDDNACEVLYNEITKDNNVDDKKANIYWLYW